MSSKVTCQKTCPPGIGWCDLILKYVIMLRILRQEHPGLFRWAPTLMTNVFRREDRRQIRKHCGDCGRDWCDASASQDRPGA